MPTEHRNKYGSVVNLNLAAAVDIGTEVKLTAAFTVGAAESGNFSIGVLKSQPDSYPGMAAVWTPYGERITATFGGTVSWGDRLKLGTNGTGGNQRYVKFTPGTDEAGLERGIALEAGTADSTGEILRY